MKEGGEAEDGNIDMAFQVIKKCCSHGQVVQKEMGWDGIGGGGVLMTIVGFR